MRTHKRTHKRTHTRTHTIEQETLQPELSASAMSPDWAFDPAQRHEAAGQQQQRQQQQEEPVLADSTGSEVC